MKADLDHGCNLCPYSMGTRKTGDKGQSNTWIHSPSCLHMDFPCLHVGLETKKHVIPVHSKKLRCETHLNNLLRKTMNEREVLQIGSVTTIMGSFTSCLNKEIVTVQYYFRKMCLPERISPCLQPVSLMLAKQ